ncbi:MAG: Flp pilus assembly protein CpaB [Solirubrobacterales bacterium]|nr:Flp pilus assembly protein CpaB [Solirubrobacterales bacterium]
MIAAVGLVGVFLLIASYVSNVAREVGPMTKVLVLTQPVQPNASVPSNIVTLKSLPVKWAPPTALTDPLQTSGLVAASALPAGHYLQQGDLKAPPTLTSNQVEIGVYLDPETGLTGQIAAGDLVDIIATYSGSPQGTRNSAQLLVPSVKVLNIGPVTSSVGSPGGVAQVVYFSLTPDQALKVSYAQSFGHQVRLALVAAGSSSPTPTPPPYQPTP